MTPRAVAATEAPGTCAAYAPLFRDFIAGYAGSLNIVIPAPAREVRRKSGGDPVKRIESNEPLVRFFDGVLVPHGCLPGSPPNSRSRAAARPRRGDDGVAAISLGLGGIRRGRVQQPKRRERARLMHPCSAILLRATLARSTSSSPRLRVKCAGRAAGTQASQQQAKNLWVDFRRSLRASVTLVWVPACRRFATICFADAGMTEVRVAPRKQL